jgi:integrase/recombinase XerD
MAKHNAANERIKRDYFRLLKEARGYDEASVDGVAASIARFETYTRHKGFDRFHIEQAIAFKLWFAEQKNARTGKPLSRATMKSTMRSLREFFLWLSGQPGFRSRISFGDTAYFRMSEKDARAAQAAREAPVPSLEQIEAVLVRMPTGTALERRDRAVLAFTILTGARDNAIASLRLGHVDVGEKLVFQDPRVVRTKASKTIRTWFFPIVGSAEGIVLAWIEELRQANGWGDDDPIFPATEVALNAERQFAAVGLRRAVWANADPIRKIFRRAFEAAGQTYYNPHSFRKTLARLGERLCRTPEQFKAWSQNLGHDQTSTTFSSYGEVELYRQAEIMHRFRNPIPRADDNISAMLERAGLKLSRV